MDNELFSWNMSDTQKIDLLLEKVNSVEKIVQNRHKYKIKYPNFKIGKYRNSKIWTNGMIEVYDAINNTYNQFDHNLAKKVWIYITWSKRSYASYSGLYYPGSRNIKLNIAYENFYETRKTFYHELGHAWYYQLPKKLKNIEEDNLWKLAWNTIKKYLKLSTGTSFSSFKQAKTFIRVKISDYATTNIRECFAELFEKSCSEAFELREKGKNPFEHSNAFKAINYFNNFLKS